MIKQPTAVKTYAQVKPLPAGPQPEAPLLLPAEEAKADNSFLVCSLWHCGHSMGSVFDMLTSLSNTELQLSHLYSYIGIYVSITSSISGKIYIIWISNQNKSYNFWTFLETMHLKYCITIEINTEFFWWKKYYSPLYFSVTCLLQKESLLWKNIQALPEVPVIRPVWSWMTLFNSMKTVLLQ